MTAISQQLAVEYPRTNEKTGALVRSLRDHLVGNVELAVAMLGGVLRIASRRQRRQPSACSRRPRERVIAVLRERRGRLIQQLLLESPSSRSVAA